MEAGEGAIGRAQVYGKAIDPLQYYLQQGAQNRQYQAQQQQQQLKQRDDLIKELRQFNPDKVWEPFYDEVNRYVQGNIRDFSTNALSAGIPAQSLIPELEKRKGDANTLANKINWLKQQYTDLGKRIDDDDYLDANYYHRKLNDKIFNGNIAKQSSEIDLSDAEGIFRDSRGYKVDKVLRDFMKDLPEQVNQYYTKVFEPLGQTYDIQETHTKLGHEYKTVMVNGKPVRQVVVDPKTGMPKINMTDDVFIQATGNEYLMNIVNDGLTEAGQPLTTENQKKYLTGLLSGLDNNKIKQDIRLGFKKPESSVRNYLFKGGYGYTIPIDDIESRDKLLTRIVTSDAGDDILSYFNNINKDVKVEYSTDENGKQVIKVKYPAAALVSQEEWDTMDPIKKKLMESQRVVKDETLNISTEGEQRASKIFLSKLMDEIDRKRSIGQEYPTYINEKRELASKKQGASGIKWKK